MERLLGGINDPSVLKSETDSVAVIDPPLDRHRYEPTSDCCADSEGISVRSTAGRKKLPPEIEGNASEVPVTAVIRVSKVSEVLLPGTLDEFLCFSLRCLIDVFAFLICSLMPY